VLAGVMTRYNADGSVMVATWSEDTVWHSEIKLGRVRRSAPADRGPDTLGADTNAQIEVVHTWQPHAVEPGARVHGPRYVRMLALADDQRSAFVTNGPGVVERWALEEKAPKVRMAAG
jgi:hypothetical protein